MPYHRTAQKLSEMRAFLFLCTSIKQILSIVTKFEFYYGKKPDYDGMMQQASHSRDGNGRGTQAVKLTKKLRKIDS